MAAIQPVDKIPDGCRLLPKETCRAHVKFKFSGAHLAKLFQLKQTGLAQVPERPSRIPPACILGKNCPHDHFHPRAGGPPTLRAERVMQSLVVLDERGLPLPVGSGLGDPHMG